MGHKHGHLCYLHADIGISAKKKYRPRRRQTGGTCCLYKLLYFIPRARRFIKLGICLFELRVMSVIKMHVTRIIEK